MPVRGHFFDSQGSPGDRIYTSESWAQLLRRLYSNGVMLWTGAELQVTPTTPATLGVQVALGAGLADGRFGELYDAPLTLTLLAADPANPRIDTIVLRRNVDPAVRAATIERKTGTPAVSPAAPALQQDATIWEEPLANVAVAAGATSIVNANITDRRASARAADSAKLAGRVPGATAGNIPILDANARVPNATLLQGAAPGTAAGDIPLLGTGGRLAQAQLPSGTVIGHYRHRMFGNAGEAGYSVAVGGGWTQISRTVAGGPLTNLPAVAAGLTRRIRYALTFANSGSGANATSIALSAGSPGVAGSTIWHTFNQNGVALNQAWSVQTYTAWGTTTPTGNPAWWGFAAEGTLWVWAIEAIVEDYIA